MYMYLYVVDGVRFRFFFFFPSRVSNEFKSQMFERIFYCLCVHDNVIKEKTPLDWKIDTSKQMKMKKKKKTKTEINLKLIFCLSSNALNLVLSNCKQFPVCIELDLSLVNHRIVDEMKFEKIKYASITH